MEALLGHYVSSGSGGVWIRDMSTWRVCVCVCVFWRGESVCLLAFVLVSREFTETHIYLHLLLHKHNVTVCEAYTDTLSFLCS